VRVIHNMKRTPFRDLPIRHKLMFISLQASSVALALACIGFVTYELITYRRAALDRLETVARVIAANSSAAILFDDPDAAIETLSGLRAEREIISACIYVLDGSHFASYRRDSSESNCSEWTTSAARRQTESGGIVVSVPVEVRGETVGTLLIHSESVDVFERLLRYGSIVAVVLLVSGLVAFVLASRLQKYISAPVLRLADTSRRISSEKNYALRAATEGSDEIGVLSKSFNEMLEQIQGRDRALEAHRDHLEETVRLRTTELSKAVDELRQEIQQREVAEDRIRYLAYYDDLTGLPNRQFLKEGLSRSIKEASQHAQILALLFLDLDRFKEINDNFGHTTGDALLQQVAERLKNSVRDIDFVSRTGSDGRPATVTRQGGDEFTILLTSIRSPEDAGRVARRILLDLEMSFPVRRRELVVSGSIGIAVYPYDGQDVDTLLKHADTAMYHAKEGGRNDYEFFSESMKVAAIEKFTLESDLRKAIDRQEFLLLYQPRLDLHTGTIVGVEALLRWRHPDKGIVSPAEFIPVAENAGLIVSIGEWVLWTACRQANLWAREGLPRLTVAVNVSGRQFHKGTLVRTVTEVLSGTDLDPRLLEIEITESTTMKDENQAVETLTCLKRLGVRVALDDFGTGYSSLSYLRRFPLDSLKIDRSYTADLTTNVEIASIVTAVIEMAHSLGLRAVAEGVETAEQEAFLRAHGCDEIQGYYLSRPVAAESVAELVRTAEPVAAGLERRKGRGAVSAPARDVATPEG
jgi:diguanylate cyclase (GGDEF)-like protein